jgi:hypothetical protein
MAKEKPIIQQSKERKWQWIGHSLRQDPQAVERLVLNWSPQGRRKRGRLKEDTEENGRRRDFESGKEVLALAGNRIRCRCCMESLCS